jgi:hypothetical protein
MSSVVTDPAEIERLDRLDIRSLVRDQMPFYVKVAIYRLSGRRVS